MDERTIIVKKNSVGSFLQGIAIGAALALLFAPRSGRETRDILAERSGEIKDRATDIARDTRYRAQNYIEDARVKVQDTVKDVANKAQDTVKNVKQGVQSGASEMDKTLREENRDLKREAAIDEDINNPMYPL